MNRDKAQNIQSKQKISNNKKLNLLLTTDAELNKKKIDENLQTKSPSA